jgi:uncharacterized protein
VAEGVDLPDLGVGLIYFPGLEPVIEIADGVLDLIEVEPQPVSRLGDDGRLHLREEVAAFLAAQSQPVLVHSVGAPVAGTVHATDMLMPAAEAVARLRAPWASEHLNFDRFATPDGVRFANFLLPAVQSPETVELAAANIRAMRDIVGVPVAVETPVNYLRPHPDELDDGVFLRAVAEEADCGLLVDLHNLMCNERNGRQPVLETVGQLPVERVWEIHLAGGQELDGYWVDAHSGLVEDVLWDLAEEVIPRLPGLRAVNFEIMPEYFQAGRIPPAAIVRQLERMRGLWDARGSRPARPVPPTPAPERERVPPASANWESALGAQVTVAPADQALATDPGVAIYRTMIRSVRCGVVVDALRLTYRLLALSLGGDETERLLHEYVEGTPACAVPDHELRQFVAWLPEHVRAIPHLDEVAAFELAVIAAHLQGSTTTIPFTSEPLAILEALGAGRLPDPGEEVGDFELTITP